MRERKGKRTGEVEREGRGRKIERERGEGGKKGKNCEAGER